MQNLLRNIKSIRNKIDNLKKNIHNEFDALIVAKNKNHHLLQTHQFVLEELHPLLRLES